MKSLFLFFITIGIGFAIGYSLAPSSMKSPISSDEKDIANGSKNFFSLEQAPSKSLRGRLRSIVGDVKLQSRLATEPAALSSEAEILQGEALATGEDGSLTVEFENGALLNISAESHVDFVQTLPEHIVMIQKEGIVEYQPAKNSFLSVRSMHLLADITAGTYVTIEKDAEFLIFTVKKGSVNVAFNNLENVTTKAIIAEGETYIFNDDTREGEITK